MQQDLWLSCTSSIPTSLPAAIFTSLSAVVSTRSPPAFAEQSSCSPRGLHAREHPQGFRNNLRRLSRLGCGVHVLFQSPIWLTCRLAMLKVQTLRCGNTKRRVVLGEVGCNVPSKSKSDPVSPVRSYNSYAATRVQSTRCVTFTIGTPDTQIYSKRIHIDLGCGCSAAWPVK